MDGACLLVDDLMANVVASSGWITAGDLIQQLQAHHDKFSSPEDPWKDNILRRVIKIVKDEYRDCCKKPNEPRSLHSFVMLTGGRDGDYNTEIPELKDRLLEAVQSLKDDIFHSEATIAKKSVQHIQSEELILTFGSSKYVAAFLRKAAKNRKFHVIVVDTPDDPNAKEMARELSSGMQVTVIPHSTVFAVMPRVNKVIIEPHSVYANGGCKAMAGMHVVAMAAKHYSKTFLACAPIFKFCPKYVSSAHDKGFNKLGPIDSVLDRRDGDLIGKVRVLNPMFDYVPPELVTLFITETGDHPPSYIFRLLSEQYSMDDHL